MSGPLGKFCTEHYWDYSQEGDPQMEAICKDYLKHPRLIPISNWPEKLGYEAGDAIVNAIKGKERVIDFLILIFGSYIKLFFS